jgi:hypothetical protein
MAIPPLLALNAFDTLPLQVHEITGGTSASQIGSNISTGSPAVYVPSVVVKGNHNGHAKTFKGERYCITLTSGNYHVRREDEGGSGVWGIVYTSTAGASLNGSEFAGLHIVQDGNDIALVSAWGRGAPDNLVLIKSNDGASWSETTFSPGYAPRCNSTTVVFRNKLYWADGISLTGANTRVHEVDPSALTHTVYTAPWNSVAGLGFGSGDFCVAFDKLWHAAMDQPGLANGRLTLYEFTGSGWTQNSFIGNTNGHNNQSDATQGKYCLWTDNTNLYVVGYTEKDENDTGGQLGSSVWRGVPSGSTFTWTQDDTTMVNGLRPNDRGITTNARQDRWSIYVDNDTDPTAPAYYLIVVQGPAPGTGHAVYRWEGFGTEMGSGTVTGESGPGASVSTAFALPETKHGGGEAISQGVASYAEIEDETPIIGGYRLSYRVWGTQSGLTGRVYFSTEQGPPDTLASIVGGGTTINSITGDSGGSLRTVDIDLSTSGITAPDISTWMIKLS